MEQRVIKIERPPILAVTNAQPVVAVSPIWRTAAQAATIGIFVVLFLAALSLARSILLPVAAAFVITMMLSPLTEVAGRYRVPQIVSAILLWLLAVAVFYGVIAMVTAPVLDWIGKAPDIGRTIQEKLRLFEEPLAQLQSLRDALLPANGKGSVGFDIISVVQPVVAMASPAIGEIFIFFGALFFMLLGRNRLRRVIVAFFDDREARLRTLRIMHDVEHNLTGYMSVVAVINIGIGIAAGVIAWAVGLPDPVAWAVLGFVLNFISYIGAFIMVAALFSVGLVTFPSLAHALAAPLLYVAVATLEGHFITPSIVGRRLTLNPLTVFLSLAFWAWLWGPVGAFLAVPILIVALVVSHHLFPKAEATLPE